MANVAVVGTGYVGSVTAVCLAWLGHDVVGYDTNPARAEQLSAGELPIYEPGLDDKLREAQATGRLTFTADAAKAASNADVIFLCVGTPTGVGGMPDMSQVEGAAHGVAPYIKDGAVVVNKSTVPVGSGNWVRTMIEEAQSGSADPSFHVVSNPEFLREGAAIRDFKHPDRIVIGTVDERARELMRELYRPLYLNRAPILFTERRTAELTKYAANAFLATKITFINEIADLAEKVGADVQEIARGIGLDNRIGEKFLHAGPGYGGSCFPKDTVALLKTGQDYDAPLRVVEAVVAVNDARKRAMARKVSAALGGELRGKTVAVLGLTFKPNTDDMREAPSIPLITALQDMGAAVRAYDPEGMQQAKAHVSNVTFCDDAYACAQGASALVIVTEWEQFRALDFERLKAAMARPLLVDLRNIYAPEEVRRAGFAYESVGRGKK